MVGAIVAVRVDWTGADGWPMEKKGLAKDVFPRLVCVSWAVGLKVPGVSSDNSEEKDGAPVAVVEDGGGALEDRWAVKVATDGEISPALKENSVGCKFLVAGTTVEISAVEGTGVVKEVVSPKRKGSGETAAMRDGCLEEKIDAGDGNLVLLSEVVGVKKVVDNGGFAPKDGPLVDWPAGMIGVEVEEGAWEASGKRTGDCVPKLGVDTSSELSKRVGEVEASVSCADCPVVELPGCVCRCPTAGKEVDLEEVRVPKAGIEEENVESGFFWSDFFITLEAAFS